MTLIIAKKPTLQVIAHVQGDKLVSLELKPYHAFALEFKGESKKHQKWLHEWLLAYSLGKAKPLTDLELSIAPPFTQDVLKILIEVPFGKTLSYKELALASGHPKAYRAAGQVCGRNLYPILIPCHRVITQAGTLGGFAFGIKMKNILLDFEKEYASF